MSKSFKNISVVAGATMASRVLGLLRESLTARVFGVEAIVSAFVSGLTLPNLFRRLLAEGGMTAAFVPTLNAELHRGERAAAFRLVNQVASWLLAITGGLVVLAMLVFSQGWLVRGAAELFHAEPDSIARLEQAAHFTVILFPYLLFVSLAAAFSGALQSLQRFLEPALSPIWLNLSVIGSLAVAMGLAMSDPQRQMHWLCAGWLLGGLLQMAVPAWALTREGWRPRLDFEVNGPLRAMVRLMVPTLFSSSIYLVNLSASRVIGLSLNDAAVAVLNFAQRLMELPIGVFAVAVSTVVFPLISRYAAAGDRANLAAAYRKGMRLILVINVPAAAGLVVLAEPIIRVIFEGGKFDAEATRIMMPVLVANAVGLPFLSFASLALRAFYAQKDTVIPVRAALLSFGANIGLSIVLMQMWSTVGLAIASSVASAVQAIYLQAHLARKDAALSFRFLAGDLMKIVAATAVMSGAVVAGWWGWSRIVPENRLTDAAGVAVLITLGAALYGAVVWLLRIEGREDLAAVAQKVFRRRAAATQPR